MTEFNSTKNALVTSLLEKDKKGKGIYTNARPKYSSFRPTKLEPIPSVIVSISKNSYHYKIGRELVFPN